MKSADYQKMLVVLLATVSLGTTVLIGINIANRPRADVSGPALAGGPMVATDGMNPPVLINVPAFTLTDQSGQPFGSEQLAGKAWIAAFIFTRCQGPCPMMASQMAQLQFDLQEHPRWSDIRLVCISVDPDHDTPERLTEYARWLHADPEHWKFLTGTRQQVWQLIEGGFKLPVGEAPENPRMPIFHSQKFLLLDGQSRIRGLYDGLEAEGRGELRRDLELLLEQM